MCLGGQTVGGAAGAFQPLQFHFQEALRRVVLPVGMVKAARLPMSGEVDSSVTCAAWMF